MYRLSLKLIAICFVMLNGHYIFAQAKEHTVELSGYVVRYSAVTSDELPRLQERYGFEEAKTVLSSMF